MWYSEMPANVWPSSQRRSLYIQLSAACLREFFEEKKKKVRKSWRNKNESRQANWQHPRSLLGSHRTALDSQTPKSLTSEQHLTIPPVPFSQDLDLPTEGKETSPQSFLHHCQSHIDINFPDSSVRAKTMSGACVPPAVRLQNSIRNGSCVFYRCCSLLLLLCEFVLFSLKGSRIGLQQQGPQQHEPFSNNFSSFPEKEEFPWFKLQRVQSKRGLPYRSTAAKQIRDIANTKALLCVFNA